MLEEGEATPVTCSISEDEGQRLEDVVFDIVENQYGNVLPYGWKQSARATQIRAEGPYLEVDVFLPQEHSTYSVVANVEDTTEES